MRSMHDFVSSPSLPVELLIHVFSIDSTPRLLWTLCLVSKQFLAVAQPLLYRSFRQGSGVYTNGLRRSRGLFAFGRTLLSRPDLGGLVTSFDVCDWCRSEDEERRERRLSKYSDCIVEMDAESDRLQDELFPAPQSTSENRQLARKRYSDNDRALVFILSLVSNLRTLSLELKSLDNILSSLLTQGQTA